MDTKKKNTKPLPCECGCEGMTRGGRFLPGHDARLKRNLIQEALAGSKRAENKLEKLGWKKFLVEKRAKAETAAPAKRAKKEAPEPPPKRRGAKTAPAPSEADEGSAAESPGTPEAPSARPRRGRKPKSQQEDPPAPEAPEGSSEAEAEREGH